MDNEIKCQSCEAIVSEDEAQYGTLTEATLCWGCYESDAEYGSSIIRFAPDGHEKVIFGDHTCYSGTIDEICDTDAPAWFLNLFGGKFKGRNWVSTDAWRGYHDTVQSMENAVKIVDGWMTGNWGDVPHKAGSHDILEQLQSGKLEAPFPIYVLFESTSNIFSVATTYLVDKDKEDEARKWFENLAVDLESALS